MSCLVSEDLETVTQMFVQNKSEQDYITEEANEVLQNLKSILTYEHQRRSIQTGLGVWYCLKKEKAHYLCKFIFYYVFIIEFIVKNLDTLF